MTEIEWHDDLIDEICRCVYLVTSGDGELSEEEENSLGDVRVNRPYFPRHLSAIQNSYKRGAYEQQSPHRKIAYYVAKN